MEIFLVCYTLSSPSANIISGGKGAAAPTSLSHPISSSSPLLKSMWIELSASLTKPTLLSLSVARRRSCRNRRSKPPSVLAPARSLSSPSPLSSSNLSLPLPFAFFFVPLSSRRPRQFPARLAAIHGCDGRRCYLRSQASTLCEFSSLIFYIFFIFRRESERIRNGLGCLGLGILESVRGSINFTS